MTHRTAGFTLIELLVCIVIAGVLLSLAIVGLRYSRESARDAACKSNVRQLVIVTASLSDAHRSRLPYFRPGRAADPQNGRISESQFVDQAGLSPAVLVCPSDRSRALIKPGVLHWSYDYFASDFILEALARGEPDPMGFVSRGYQTSPDAEALFGDSRPRHSNRTSKRNGGFLPDGHVRWLEF